jgi:YVTN family beta-propeller protein
MWYRYLPLLGLVLFPFMLGERSLPAKSKESKRPVFKSPLGLSVDQKGERAYVALHTTGTVAVVDLKASKVLKEIAVGKGPYDVAIGKGKLFVTCETENTLVRVNLTKQVVEKRIPVGQSPRGVALIPDLSCAYVVCADVSKVSWIDLDKESPLSLAILPGTDRVLLSPSGFGVSFSRQQSVTSLSRKKGDFSFPPGWEMSGVSNLRGFAESDAQNIFILHQRPKSHVPTTQVAQGWVFTNSFFFFHPFQIAFTASLDEVNRGCADPSDVVITPDMKKAFISCAGVDTVVLVDVKRLLKYITKLYGKNTDEFYDSGDNLTASRHFVASRLKTQANPRRLALSGDGNTLVVSNYLADSLTVIDVARRKVLRHISLGGPKPDAARRGEILFNSGKMTFQGQFTCASCHPNGGSDGLTWDLTRDGIGNFKKTKSLLGVRDTAPYGWHGSSPTLADRVAGTLRTLHRHEPVGTEVSDIVAYLKTLPPPRPLPVKKADLPALARGRALFQGKGRCVNCHRGETSQDGKLHDIGTRGQTDTQDAFDTPSLRGVARHAPYLHDGQANTLEAIFQKHNPKRRHGAAHKLSKQELADLIAYLKSL